jgi:hypothetical protein
LGAHEKASEGGARSVLFLIILIIIFIAGYCDG